jgi:UDP-N-acetyl-alpha-D-quinovosamine dehydrogenase
MKLLLTGANGFVGKCCSAILGKEHSVLSTVRTDSGFQDQIIIPSIDANTQWTEALVACDIVIHCAARVHVMNDSVNEPLTAFREVNVEGTANLARQAAAAGVKRFVFLSSIKVNGEFSELDAPFSYNDAPAPEDSYGVSKNEAEQILKEICAETGMEYVIIRPPLVYGPGVKANFLSMLKWLSRGVPLPLGWIRNNRRSLVYLDNLVDLIRVCIEHSNAANQTFLVSDNHDVSTCELLANTARALSRPLRLLNIPPKWLGFIGKLLGKKDIEQRLSASLQVDISHTQQMLNWEPPYSMEEGLKHTSEWFKQHRG